MEILEPSLVPTFDNSWALSRAQTFEEKRSRLWACPWLCHSQAQWPSLAMAVANALSSATLAMCRNHRGGLSTNLKPGKHSLSEFKHPHRQQPQTGICTFLLQLNPMLSTPSTSSRCWCLKWAQVGKSQFPEGEIPFSVVRLLQGVKSSGQGTIFPAPPPVAYGKLSGEAAKGLHLNCSWRYLIPCLLTGSL